MKILADFQFGVHLQSLVLTHATTHSRDRYHTLPLLWIEKIMDDTQAVQMDIILNGFLNPKKEVLGYANAKSVRDNCTELKMISDSDFEHLLFLIRKEQLKLGMEFISGQSIFHVNKKLISDFLKDGGFEKIYKKRVIKKWTKILSIIPLIYGIIKFIEWIITKVNP